MTTSFMKPLSQGRIEGGVPSFLHQKSIPVFQLRGLGSHHFPRNLQDVLSLMSIVDGSRTTKSHAINDRSSRSHCIVTVTTPRTGGKFLFVDLAGEGAGEKHAVRVTNPQMQPQ